MTAQSPPPPAARNDEPPTPRSPRSHSLLDKLPALIASVALLVLGVAALAAATGPARAQAVGPAFSGGDFPLLSWESPLAYNQSPTIYTVPAGKKLVLSTACTNSSSWQVTKNGAVFLHTAMTTHPSNDDAWSGLCLGRGRVVLDAGDTFGLLSGSGSTNIGYYRFEGSLMTE